MLEGFCSCHFVFSTSWTMPRCPPMPGWHKNQGWFDAILSDPMRWQFGDGEVFQEWTCLIPSHAIIVTDQHSGLMKLGNTRNKYVWCCIYHLYPTANFAANSAPAPLSNLLLWLHGSWWHENMACSSAPFEPPWMTSWCSWFTLQLLQYYQEDGCFSNLVGHKGPVD